MQIALRIGAPLVLALKERDGLIDTNFTWH